MIVSGSSCVSNARFVRERRKLVHKKETLMARIHPIPYEDASPEMKPEYDAQIAANGRMTNMKRTLAHAPTAFRALMTWYPLFEEVKAFLGERQAILFAHAISSQTDCLICSTFFRRILKEWGEDPDQLALTDTESVLVRYGRQLVTDPNQVDDALYAEIASLLPPEGIVLLTTFGGIMIATNVFNNALRVPLDDYLFPYQLHQTQDKTTAE